MFVLRMRIHELENMPIYLAQEEIFREDSPTASRTDINLSHELKFFSTSVGAIDTGMSQWRLSH